EGRRLLWASMRSGNSGSANGCVEFLKQALTVLPEEHRIGLVRADAGFFEKRLLGVSGKPAVALHYCGPINGGGTKARDSSDPIDGVACGSPRDRCGRCGRQVRR